MAVATVTNTSGLVLNALEQGLSGVSSDAVGGNVLRPVPFPFNMNGSYAIGGNKVLPMRERDIIVRQQPQQPEMPADELNNYVQRGWITFAVAADATPRDVEDEVINSI